MKFKQIDDTKLEALRIKNRGLREEDAGMNKFHMVYTVDGVKSEQDISAANVMKAEELIRKQYDGKNIIFTSKQPVKENLREAYGYKVSYDDLIEIQGKIDRLIRKMADNHQDEISPSSNTYRIGLPFIGTREGYIDLQNMNQYIEGHEDDWDDEDEYDESLNEDLASPESKVLEADEKLPQTEETVGLSNAIIQEINGEWETIQHYNDLISIMRTEGRDDMINVISDIIDEENKHVGQLQKCLQMISPNVSEIDSGETEAIGQLYTDDSCLDCADDDFGPNSGFDIYLV